MTTFENMVIDYPKRCLDILQAFLPQASALRRDVTLMLCIASAAIPTPLERLDRMRNKNKHASGDADRFRQLGAAIDDLYEVEFLSSMLSQGEGHGCRFEWRQPFALADGAWTMSLRDMNATVTVRDVLETLRHALSHGNIYCPAEPTIATIGFVNCRKTTYACLALTPHDFHTLLVNWLKFLGKHGVKALCAA